MQELRDEARAVGRLAWPAILTQVAMMLMGMVDTLMVARLGTETLAASTLGTVWVFGTLVIAMGVLQGLDPLITQAHGAGDGPKMGRALQRGLVLGLLMSLPIGALWLFTGSALEALQQRPDLAAQAHGYARVQVGSIPFFMVFITLRQYLTGRGLLTPAMWVMWSANLVNVALNWALIFGHLGFEPRGLIGAGYATALSRLYMCGALVAIVLWGRLHEGAWVPWSRAAVERGGLAEVLRYGIPVGVSLGLEMWTFQFTTVFAGWLGATALAAHAITLQLASLTFMVPLGLAIAGATRVGNLTGAGDPNGARRAAWASMALAIAFMSTAAASFILLRHQLPRLWSDEAAVLAAAASILPIAGAFQIFDGTQVVGCGVLRGIGDTRPAAWFNLIGYYALALPVGYVLAFRLGYGLRGLWAGLAIGLATVAVLLVVRIRRRL